MEKLFLKELEELINKYNQEKESNTPDFIIAEYLYHCLKAFNNLSKKREQWYGKELKII